MEKQNAKKSLTIGIVCIATYLSNYYLRNILSVLTPQLLETGNYTVEHIGLLSSTYMLLYAAGQFVNGFLGDFLSLFDCIVPFFVPLQIPVLMLDHLIHIVIAFLLL